MFEYKAGSNYLGVNFVRANFIQGICYYYNIYIIKYIRSVALKFGYVFYYEGVDLFCWNRHANDVLCCSYVKLVPKSSRDREAQFLWILNYYPVAEGKVLSINQNKLFGQFIALAQSRPQKRKIRIKKLSTNEFPVSVGKYK